MVSYGGDVCWHGLDNLDLTLVIEDLISEEQKSMELAIAIYAIIGRYVNPDALMKNIGQVMRVLILRESS